MRIGQPTVDHAQLLGVTANQHHNESHAARHLSSGADTIEPTVRHWLPANNGGTTGSPTASTAPGYQISVHPDAATSGRFFGLRLTDYVSGDVTIRVVVMDNGATAGNVVYEMAYQAHPDNNTEAAGALTTTTTTYTASGVDLRISAVTFTIAAANVAQGDVLALRIQRLGADAADTYAADHFFLGVLVSYTGELP